MDFPLTLQAVSSGVCIRERPRWFLTGSRLATPTIRFSFPSPSSIRVHFQHLLHRRLLIIHRLLDGIFHISSHFQLRFSLHRLHSLHRGSLGVAAPLLHHHQPIISLSPLPLRLVPLGRTHSILRDSQSDSLVRLRGSYSRNRGFLPRQLRNALLLRAQQRHCHPTGRFTDPRNPFSARFLHFFVVITIASFYWLRRRRRENRTDFRGKQFHWRTTAVVPPISCRRRCDAFPAQNARAHVATGIFGFLRHCATAAKMAPFRPTGGNVGGNRRNAPGAKFHTCRKKRPWRNKHVVLVVGGRSTPAGIACECVSLSRIT